MAFRADEGRNLNSFVRDDDVSAHLVLRGGLHPRIVIAFPAGNSGAGLWFEPTEGEVRWELLGALRPVRLPDANGRMLRGIEAEIAVTASHLTVKEALQSSVRVLRDYETLGRAPAEVQTPATVEANTVTWSRDRLDGAAGFRLSIQVLAGHLAVAAGPGQTPIEIDSRTTGRLRLKVTALTGETPLTPISREELLTTDAVEDVRERHALEFLSYHEKYLAGSWRFNTYFGRDTLISLALLAPVLRSPAMESGIASVLARMAPNGEVAHEEGIGEFALLSTMATGRASDAPIYDYSMIDDDFLLAPVVAGYLLDSDASKSRGADFLAARMVGGKRHGDALVENLVWVVQRSAGFASHPVFRNLIGLKPGRVAGQWRDSEAGLGGGQYPYDVNVVLVPAALKATDRLLKSGLLDEYLSGSHRRILMRAEPHSAVWAHRAASLFHVAIPLFEARAQVAAYARTVGVDDRAALASLGTRMLKFPALALDAEGRPIRVVHSDEGLALLFGQPTPQDLERQLSAMMRPFPAGLLTSIGVLVANPAFVNGPIQAKLDSSAYHGTVVWSWQQAVLAAGLNKQLARPDLPRWLRDRVLATQVQVWSALENTRQLRTSELWSWSFANGGYFAVPFGTRGSDVDESNAVQLWSVVYLAVDRSRPTVLNRGLAIGN